MKVKWLIAVLLLLLAGGCACFVAGCGTVKREDFTTNHTFDSNPDPYVRSRIWSKVRTVGRLPLFGYRTYSAPYTLRIDFWSHNRPKEGVLIHSIALKEGANTVFQLAQETPMRIEFEWNSTSHRYKASFRETLPDSVEFADGKELNLSIEWAIPGIADRQFSETQFVGERSRKRVPLLTDI